MGAGGMFWAAPWKFDEVGGGESDAEGNDHADPGRFALRGDQSISLNGPNASTACPRCRAMRPS